MVFSSLILTALCASAAGSTALDAYSAFRVVHRSGQTVAEDAVGFAERRRIFEQRRAEVDHHNSLGLSWKAAVNRFADFTDDELSRNLGLRPSSGSSEASPVPHAKASFLEVRSVDVDLPDEVDWVAHTPLSSNMLRDQGQCGSCWAVAAVSAIEMHAELNTGKVSKLSTDQVIDCAPNPDHCGGTGGCQGSTSPLAMDYVKEHGLALLEEYPGDSTHSECKDVSATKKAHIGDWTLVKVNKLQALMNAVANKGPVLVSVQGNTWFDYDSGVYAGCDENAIIGHSVVLVGYGIDAETGLRFWRIRNSWGLSWGEKGYMRLLRHDQEDTHCGTDDQPLLGFGCEADPSPIKVCGMCGLLSHPSHPNDVTIDV